ncbi:MAG: T9SS type A sorting domain-containing protein, partial [Paludibacteraceae bacterium]|nr:T9SS type A sorting domain-containing protein [Paludibacteraceae bacterium]
AKDANNQTLTLELLKKNDAVSISGGHDDFESGKKYHFAGHNEVNGVKITPPFQFDVYVVPDEVVWTWTGTAGTAWHNDANWDPAFIPMSHTNVVIPGNTKNKPVLKPSATEFESGAYKWLEHDIVAVSKGKNNVLVEAQSEDQSDDLSAVLNSCKDIYFAAGAQLANQHMLNYERAFVDVPFTGNGNDNFGKSTANYKIMSFPLRNVYRGDLYIPRNYDENTKEDIGDGDFDFPQTGAQFEAMPVNNRAYNSFYVKAYDSAIKQNHVVDNNGKNEVDYSKYDEYNYENTSWSNPTSVLNFEFEEAHGYAVSLNATTAQDFVRLPKSATEYYLFMDFGSGTEEVLNGPTWPKYEIPELQLKGDKRIRSSEGHKLVYDKDHDASVTFENKKGNIFLIGNPFMTGMNVKEFLAGNTNLNSEVYYTYEDGNIVGNKVQPNETPIIPPFGAMFVKGKTDDVKQTFKFTPAMMSYTESTEPSTQQLAPRMVEERELLTITAEVDGARSRTYIEKDFAANNEYLDTEDADLLVLDADLTPISVYSVATGAALAYNSVTDMEFVPLGLLLVDSTIVAESVRFTFDGVDYFYDELYLYDAFYNSYLPLIDGVALELEIPESGELRYFITDTKHNVGGGVATSDDLVEGSKVCVFTTEGEACIIAEDIISEATVYDIAGRLIYYSDQISSSQHNISLPNGVYMLKVVVNSNLSTHKIILK